MGSKEAKTRGGWSDWLTDRVARGLIATALALPHRTRVRLMGWLLRRVVGPLAGYRQRAMENLAHVWPDMPEAERRRIAEAACDNAGRTMIENYDVAGLLDRMKDAKVSGAGLPEIERARAEGRPVLFVTGHYGNFEAPRAALVARGWRIGGLYRPMANPFFNAHYAANMHSLSDPVFEQGRRGTMGLLRHIREGGMGVLLFDVYSSDGTPIDFLGQPAPTLSSTAEIAVKTGALFVPFFGVRQPDGVSFEAVFEAPIPHGDPVEMMREATRRLEARIAEDPGQWFWLHRRWKPKRQAKRQRKRAAANIGP
ncbi:MAG: lauroyl acyltransferase [Rhodobacteraceae bacterium]|uniref:KDO2-lipid IV(A) lauroyltransferase n=1 Tax=Salipiger profundus TaxID=1229727 RepID=A0A1U7D7R4_9RHOB|nr:MULTISPECIES: lysophospholipid acyltransferase family protein [Salipiger]APX24201.1 KDO2-lipid IV(A) lauroyltransferase [Salipiger profundus]MAB07390.1 lauroyl acyltransferase [Paracoccaceae bacterium]GFZ95327.1 lipid A biosynthesis lauroyl acyltransferase [Salipiger profundus]SFB87992.1 KDO2-lipid IV(A) lauroyltransferase [Salipiger profundus]